ncbi:hypothetical protein chiPu_0032976, partial [Chiloscyllium punctatum]|nr:hypothetical protein [Chiloscyllium punctatum]
MRATTTGQLLPGKHSGPFGGREGAEESRAFLSQAVPLSQWLGDQTGVPVSPVGGTLRTSACLVCPEPSSNQIRNIGPAAVCRALLCPTAPAFMVGQPCPLRERERERHSPRLWPG